MIDVHRLLERLERRRHDERGTISPLIIAFIVVIVMLLVVVVDAAQLWVYQRGLHSIADGASLDAANAIDPTALYNDGVGEEIELNRELAQQAVDQYVQVAAGDQAASAQGVTCTAQLASATEVEVTCNGVAKLPITGYVTSGRSEIPVESSAAAQTRVPN